MQIPETLKQRVKKFPTIIALWKLSIRFLNLRVIIDAPFTGIKRTKYKEADVGYPCDLDREEISREVIFAIEGDNLNFLDVGGLDGELKYLLGTNRKTAVYSNDFYLDNYKRFHEKYNYYGLDLVSKSENVLVGDICDKKFIVEHADYLNSFDVIYSNNTFEHLRRPWVAIENIYKMLRKGGMSIIIAPFSWRYHEVPEDYFRYSHSAVPAMFNDIGEVETIVSGYDLGHRREYNQGDGDHNDLVPTDNFGAWRESWQMISVIKKLGT